MANCYLSEKVDVGAGTHRCEGGFMGRSHATSAVALFMFGVAFFPLVTERLLGTENIWLIIMAALTMAGASLIPDLDNTSSTARNSLGPVGHVASELVRVTSVFIQTLIRTSRDDADPNPHRGAAHTLPAAALCGAAAWLLTGIGGTVTLPLVGEAPWGDLAAILVVFAMTHLALSGIAKPFMKKIGDNGPLGELTSFALSLAIVLVLYLQAPKDESFWWLGVAVAAGCVVHIVGDCFTTAGCPVLFPLPRRGKLWYNVRFTSIKAGGVVENVIFVPFFCLVIFISTLRVIGIL